MRTEVIIAICGLAASAFIGYIEGFDACQRANERAVAAARDKILAEAKEKAEKNAEVISDFTKKIQTLEARNRSLSASAARLSERLRAAGMSPADSDPSGTCSKRLARCQELLGESLGLLSEGAGLAERIAARKDAIAKMK